MRFYITSDILSDMMWLKDRFFPEKPSTTDLVQKWISDPRAFRLSSRLAGYPNVQSEGMGSDYLVYGNVVDLAAHYTAIRFTDPSVQDEPIRFMRNIAREQLGIGDDDQELGALLETAFSSNLDDVRGIEIGGLYTRELSLDRLVEFEQNELSHNPGGILINKILRSKGRYQVGLPNIQTQDNGYSWMKEVYEGIGFRVWSGIDS